LRYTAAVWFVGLTALAASGQGAVSEILAGKLIDPEVGQWALYDLYDEHGRVVVGLRQAIVGEQKVGRETGYWVELELAPKQGLRTIYRLLLTGPADKPKNVHEVWVKSELDDPEQIPLDDVRLDALAGAKKPKRKRVGKETVETERGPIEAMHYIYKMDDGDISVWHNEDALPTGLVKFETANGKVMLRTYGAGGRLGASTMFPPEDVKAEGPMEPGPIRIIVRSGDQERIEEP
jgi:hypothetical protein